MPARLAPAAGPSDARRSICIHFPTAKLRVTVGPASPTGHHLCLARSAQRQTGRAAVRGRSAAARRRADAWSCGALSLLHAAGRGLSCRRSDQPEGGRPAARRIASIGSSQWMRICIAPPTSSEVFPGIEADNLSAMPAIAETLRTDGIDPATVIIGPDAESRPWVSDLARPARSQPYGCAKDAPRRSFGRNQL